MYGAMADAVASQITFRTWVQMMRPGFLLITAVACGLGTATAHANGVVVQPALAGGAAAVALLMHALANVFNDYHDALNGADEANTQGVFPFTGGSRLIQTGRVTLAHTRQLAWVLLALCVSGALWLLWMVGPSLLGVGLVGLFFVWAYSAPPLALMCRGLGELTVGLSWGLMVLGADYVQRGAVAPWTLSVALSYGLLIGNILLINGLPDAQADARVGKRTLAVRLGPGRVAAVYGVWAGVSMMVLGWGAAFGHLPAWCAWGVLPAPLSVWATWVVVQHAFHQVPLRSALVATIVAAVLQGLVLSWVALLV